MIVCKNCETTFEGKFCPNCAQKANTQRLTLGHFFHELFHAVTHTDKGILFLMKELLLHPGKAISEYIDGKRKKYFNPVTFFLLVSTVQILALQRLHIIDAYTHSMEQLVHRWVPKAEKATKESLKESRATTDKVAEYNKLFGLLFIPVLSLFSWLMFRKSKNNYTENLVLNILIQGQLGIFTFILVVLPFIVYPGSVLLMLSIVPFFFWIYNVIVYKQFFKQRWGISILKTSVVMIAYYAWVAVIEKIVVKIL